jgi:hypothetical protein
MLEGAVEPSMKNDTVASAVEARANTIVNTNNLFIILSSRIS